MHSGVDGYSRIPVYLQCSGNNRADTVLQLFTEAVCNYGLPSHVRCDKGVENVSVSLFLISHPLRGPGRGSVIVGRNVHNQRVERMWRDVYQGFLDSTTTSFTTWNLYICLTQTMIFICSVYIMYSFPELMST